MSEAVGSPGMATKPEHSDAWAHAVFAWVVLRWGCRVGQYGLVVLAGCAVRDREASVLYTTAFGAVLVACLTTGVRFSSRALATAPARDRFSVGRAVRTFGRGALVHLLLLAAALPIGRLAGDNPVGYWLVGGWLLASVAAQWWLVREARFAFFSGLVGAIAMSGISLEDLWLLLTAAIGLLVVGGGALARWAILRSVRRIRASLARPAARVEIAYDASVTAGLVSLAWVVFAPQSGIYLFMWVFAVALAVVCVATAIWDFTNLLHPNVRVELSLQRRTRRFRWAASHLVWRLQVASSALAAPLFPLASRTLSSVEAKLWCGSSGLGGAGAALGVILPLRLFVFLGFAANAILAVVVASALPDVELASAVIVGFAWIGCIVHLLVMAGPGDGLREVIHGSAWPKAITFLVFAVATGAATYYASVSLHGWLCFDGVDSDARMAVVGFFAMRYAESSPLQVLRELATFSPNAVLTIGVGAWYLAIGRVAWSSLFSPRSERSRVVVVERLIGIGLPLVALKESRHITDDRTRAIVQGNAYVASGDLKSALAVAATVPTAPEDPRRDDPEYALLAGGVCVMKTPGYRRLAESWLLKQPSEVKVVAVYNLVFLDVPAALQAVFVSYAERSGALALQSLLWNSGRSEPPDAWADNRSPASPGLALFTRTTQLLCLEAKLGPSVDESDIERLGLSRGRLDEMREDSEAIGDAVRAALRSTCTLDIGFATTSLLNGAVMGIPAFSPADVIDGWVLELVKRQASLSPGETSDDAVQATIRELKARARLLAEEQFFDPAFPWRRPSVAPTEQIEMEQGDSLLTIDSTRFGKLEVKARDVIRFRSGLFLTPHLQDFVLLEHVQPFCWLHAVQDPGVAFPVVDGLEFGEGYSVPRPYHVPELELSEGDDLAVLVVVDVDEDPRKTTANLRCPLLINFRNRHGVQVRLEGRQFPEDYPLWADA